MVWADEWVTVWAGGSAEARAPAWELVKVGGSAMVLVGPWVMAWAAESAMGWVGGSAEAMAAEWELVMAREWAWE